VRVLARGGRRQGRSGANYSNRTDLQTGARLPIATGPSQQYGQRAAAEAQQRAIPLRRPGVPGPAPDAFGPPPAPPPPLTAPTAAPDEPVTAGSAFGPGPGPEALGAGGRRLSDLLTALGTGGDLADLQMFARMRGL
jgi:hypothetical protein